MDVPEAMQETGTRFPGWTHHPDTSTDALRANPVCYRIRLRGILSETLLAGFPGLDARTEGRETVLVGELPDQAALYGVLSEIEALGLELLEVRRDLSLRSGAGIDRIANA